MEQIPISVKRIKSQRFFVDEYNVPENAIFRVEFKHTMQIVSAANAIYFDLRVWFTLPEQERMILDCVVQNIFEVPAIQNYIQSDGQVKLPNQTLVTIVGLALSHTRAILATHTAGTNLQDTFIPIVDPLEATIAFFKDTPNVDIFMPAKKEEAIKADNNIDLVPTDNANKSTEEKLV